MRISYWSSDVCSADLRRRAAKKGQQHVLVIMLRARRSEPVGDDDDIAFPARHHVIIMERPAVDRAPRPPLIFDDKLLAFEKIARAAGAVAVEGAEYLHQHPAEIFMKIADARQLDRKST